MSSPKTLYATFSVTFEYECQADELAICGGCRSSITNTIGSATNVCSVLGSQSKAGCPLTFELEIDVGGSWVPYASTGYVVIYNQNPSTGAFDIDTTAMTPAWIAILSPSTTYQAR